MPSKPLSARLAVYLRAHRSIPRQTRADYVRRVEKLERDLADARGILAKAVAWTDSHARGQSRDAMWTADRAWLAAARREIR